MEQPNYYSLVIRMKRKMTLIDIIPRTKCFVSLLLIVFFLNGCIQQKRKDIIGTWTSSIFNVDSKIRALRFNKTNVSFVDQFYFTETAPYEIGNNQIIWKGGYQYESG
ncbi:MAG: hypothetical protein AAFX53_04415, partial [Bacteroidota bacterium]